MRFEIQSITAVVIAGAREIAEYKRLIAAGLQILDPRNRGITLRTQTVHMRQCFVDILF